MAGGLERAGWRSHLQGTLDHPDQACTGDTFTTPYFRAWCELTIVFTREGIERALSAAEQIGSIVGGLITVNLLEPGGVGTTKGGFNGSYEMYVRVERVALEQSAIRCS